MAREYARQHIKTWGTESHPHVLAAQNSSEWRRVGKTGLWFVYTMYESQGRIKVPLYVGMTGQLLQRLSRHRAQRDWWPLVGVIIAEKFTEKWDAEDAENARIRKMRPLFNIAWNIHTPPLDRSSDAVML